MSATDPLNLMLLTLLLATAVAVVEVRSLFSSVALAAIYSLLMGALWMVNDAWDVAFTEAAVGAGVSTILLVGALVLTGRHETVRKTISWPALAACVAAGALLIWGTLDMPAYGDRNAPAQQHPVYNAYVQQTVDKAPDGKSAARPTSPQAGDVAAVPEQPKNFFDGHVPNQVTSVIVTYRAHDTLFETAVILTAGMSMILLLRGRRGNPQRGGLL